MRRRQTTYHWSYSTCVNEYVTRIQVRAFSMLLNVRLDYDVQHGHLHLQLEETWCEMSKGWGGGGGHKLQQ